MSLIFASLAVAVLLLSVSYRHALLFLNASFGKVLMVTAVFLISNMLMAWLAILFSSVMRGTMFLNEVYIALAILLILSFKSFFNTRRSKLAETIFDIKSFRFLFVLSLATAFEMFIAMAAVSLIYDNILVVLLVSGSIALFFLLLGFYAGRKPSSSGAIKLFVLVASMLYLLAALSSLLNLL
ncbi:MAG: hypothetical protein CVU11_14490 [Bacteroidetes bacterium HGW-Bacteroidetes-6]|jgi:hypothetical protein|nr:MAG: hypothetical protein CVU11_14490 [Bacteroidetes bacterium HGW-Bacteroidetes-6]